MKGHEIDSTSNLTTLHFHRVGFVARFMTMRGSERKGPSKWNVDETDFFLSPALINRKEIRTIDSLLRYVDSYENSGNIAGTGQK